MAVNQEFHFNGQDMGDIFGDIFGDMFHGGSFRRTQKLQVPQRWEWAASTKYYSNGSGADGFGQGSHFGGLWSGGGRRFHGGQFRPEKAADIHADVTCKF